ncbi:MAG: MinD/ParA family protein [Acidobacteria bacterium]|nr:MinD/ParA family protein [Acidobacteriota bacterium]MBI3428235.1 MinD/ParA family protein [Acidobacteriota bacterium]
MTDQAKTLREMAAQRAGGGQPGLAAAATAVAPQPAGAKHMRTLAVTSGKGGVGKSNVAINVALEWAALGRRVSLLDADLALANADVLFGLNPQYHLGHVLRGERSLREVVIEVAYGVRLIPGGSGVEELANLARQQHTQLISELQAFEAEADCMIIDTAAGIAENVTGVLHAADEIIIVTTPDPTAVVDAYAVIKVLHQQSPQKPLWVVVNDAVGIGDAERIFTQLQSAATRFLGRKLTLLGMIPRDARLAEAVREQVPVVLYAPDTPASRSLRLIAKQLETEHVAGAHGQRTPRSFWSALSAPLAQRSH